LVVPPKISTGTPHPHQPGARPPSTDTRPPVETDPDGASQLQTNCGATLAARNETVSSTAPKGPDRVHPPPSVCWGVSPPSTPASKTGPAAAKTLRFQLYLPRHENHSISLKKYDDPSIEARLRLQYPSRTSSPDQVMSHFRPHSAAQRVRRKSTT